MTANLIFRSAATTAFATLLLLETCASGLATYASPPTCEYGWSVCKKCIEFSSDGQGGSRCTKCAIDSYCVHVKRRLGRGGGGGGVSADAQTILTAHNGHRAKHCVSDLTWSAQLAAGAQAWASACKSNGSGGFAHSSEAWSSENGFGENLYWGTNATATSAVEWWYGEIRNYNFAAPTWNGSVGHFTQVVWRNSAQVGCAMASCGGMNLWVCRYAPTGNWNVNKPGVLLNNVPPPCK